MAGKSEGKLKFDRGISDLEARIGRGEINGPDEAMVEFWRILFEAMPTMSREELHIMQRKLLVGHAVVSEFIADSGREVPGNNPEKPN